MNSAIYINIFTSIVSIVMGVLLIGGFIPFKDLNTRLVFGAIFLGYGVYRLLNVQAKRKALKQEMEHERLKKAQEDLIRNQHNDKK